MDFKVVVEAGLTNQEAADILGVSKVMMWRYTTGQAEPRRVPYKGVDIKTKAEVMLYALNKLVEKGSLPKPELKWAPRMHHELKARRDGMVQKIKKLVDERVAKALANE